MSPSLAPEIGREEIVAVDGLGARRDLASGKAAHAAAQQIDRFTVGKTEARVVHFAGSLIGVGAHGRCHSGHTSPPVSRQGTAAGMMTELVAAMIWLSCVSLRAAAQAVPSCHGRR
jgi:hypothetical protein